MSPNRYGIVRNYNLCSTVEKDFMNPVYLSYLSVIGFYTLFGYYSIKFIKYIQNKNKEDEEDEKKKSDHKYNFNSTYKYQSNLLEVSDQKSNIIDEMILFLNKGKNCIEVLDNMLSRKTLERALVIYYIFVKKGNYKVASPDKESFVEYNSYLEYKNYDNYFLKLQGIDIDDSPDAPISYELNELFNLDNSLETDKQILIGDKEYIINQGNLNMIAWIYYSGLYEYLTTNIELKQEILKEMYDDKLLTGNLFLRYHCRI